MREKPFFTTEVDEKNFMEGIRNKAREAAKVLAFIMMTTFGPSALMAKERIERPSSEAEEITVIHKEKREKRPLSIFYVEGETGEGSPAANLRVIHQGNPKIRGDEFMCEGRFVGGPKNFFEMVCQGKIENLPSFQNNINNISISYGSFAENKDLAMEGEKIRLGIAYLAELNLLREGAELIKNGKWVRKIIDENFEREMQKFRKKYPEIYLKL
ncbi:MAG: hypothetical protein AB1465_04475 [Patescibacteria group bacterium]